MPTIKAFTLAAKKKQLNIVFDKKHSKYNLDLSYEYIRICSPLDGIDVPHVKTIVAHKKSVQLTNIESVGKHGYRFIFDDNHSALYSGEYLLMITNEQEQRWQHYLFELKKSGFSREATIDITQL